MLTKYVVMDLIIFYKFYIKVLNETDEFVIVLLQCNIPRNTHCDVKLLFWILIRPYF